MTPGRSSWPFAVAAVLCSAAPALGAPLVVIDPGHGGERMGARTPEGVAEKTIVLGVARAAKAALEQAGIRVQLTREGDLHVPLGARVNMANRLGAAAFVSIHANSSPVEDRRGCETYVLSAQPSDDVSAALIDFENEGEVVRIDEGAFARGAADGPGDVPAILRDMRRAVTHERSARLAKRLQQHMGQVGGLQPSRGLRQAPFVVLRASLVPAALLEIGYVTHAKQAEELVSPRVQKSAGEAIARGILAYLSDRS